MKISTAQERIEKYLSDFFKKLGVRCRQEITIHKDTNSLLVHAEFIYGEGSNRYGIDRYIALEEIEIEPEEAEFSILSLRIEELTGLIDNQIKHLSKSTN